MSGDPRTERWVNDPTRGWQMARPRFANGYTPEGRELWARELGASAAFHVGMVGRGVADGYHAGRAYYLACRAAHHAFVAFPSLRDVGEFASHSDVEIPERES